MHILPEGFFKIRYYGILSNRNKKTELKRRRPAAAGLVEINAEKSSLQVLVVESYRWICSKCKEGKVFVVGVNLRAAPA